MSSDVLEEILHLPPKAGDDDDYAPVLYRPNSINVIPSAVRYLYSLAPKTSSELSRQISQRNIALTQSRIDAVGELDPKRILKCYGYRFGDRPFMIVARAGKQPLSRLVGTGDLNPLDGFKLLYETGKAIQYLHSRTPPVVHGGLHPKNILVAKPDQAVLSDFGLSNVWRLLEIDDSFHESTGTGTRDSQLTPSQKLGYTAPEYILDDHSEMLPPADIYGFASVILAVLSGRHPHQGVSPSSAKGINAIVYGVSPDPKDHPKLPGHDSIWPLLQRMWSKDAADRPAIDEVMDRLGQELKIRTGEAPPETLSVDDGQRYLKESQDSSLSREDFNDGILPGELVVDPSHSTIQGLHADVRRAYWHNMGRVHIVAVKYIRCRGEMERVNRRLKREAKIWTGLQSPFILELYGFLPGKEPCLVSPWCQKGTLLEYLAHHLPSESYILELLVQVASGVDYLHSLSPAIIHGDIKPSNIVIGDDGQALLCDFGLSRLGEGSTGYTSTIGAGVGTIGYRAPELKKPGQQSMEADIYALASVILHSLSGNPPQLSVDRAREGGLPQQSDHPALPKGDRLWPLLMQCWSLDLKQRPKIGKVLDELEAERVLRSAAEAEFNLHLTGEHVRDGHFTLEVGAANQIPRKNVQTSRPLVLGYFANVYEGTMKQVDGTVVPVAIKALRQVDMRSSRSPEAKNERMNKRLNRENAVWGRLRHPNILPVLGVCPGVEPLLITPWMRNGSMSGYVGRNSDLTFVEKLNLILGAANGLAYLHSLDPPICHADIKPGNVLISDDGKNALLSDFGLSLALTILRSPDATSGDPRGTRGFQAPELVFQSMRTLAGDVYAFACLILDVLTGHFPYYELAPDKATLAMYNGQMPNPAMHAALPEADPLWALMRKCWLKDQTARPRMANVVKQLQRRIDAELHTLSQTIGQLSTDDDNEA